MQSQFLAALVAPGAGGGGGGGGLDEGLLADFLLAALAALDQQA